MAKLKTVLQSLDELDATLHDFYSERKIRTPKGEQTVFVLDQDGVTEHPDVLALKNALDRQKEDRRKAGEKITELEARLAALPEDFNLEAYEAMRNELEALKAEGKTAKPDEAKMQEMATARKNLEQKITKMEKDHATAIAAKEEQIKKREAALQRVLIDDGLTKALVDAGVGKEYLKAAKALLRSDCTVVEDETDPIGYKALVKSDLGDMEVAKYVTDWVSSDEGKVFIPPAKGGDAGGTAKPTKPTFTDKNPWSDDSLNLTEQGRIIREDRTKAEKLAKAAGKKLPPVAA